MKETVKRTIAMLLSLCLLTASMTALAAEQEPSAREIGEGLGLRVDWYPEAERLYRLYGSDRMLLQKDGLYALFGLDGKQYTDYLFEAVDQPLEDGTMAAQKGGAWGRIDPDGNTVLDFTYPSMEEAKTPVNVQILQKGGLFAIADQRGKLLTGYEYWNAKPFVNGYAALQNDQGLWGYIDGNGNVAVPFRYKADIMGVGDMGEDGFAILQTAGDYSVRAVNTRGEELPDAPVSKLWRAGQGMWGFTEGGLVGFADSEGNVVIEPQYTYYTDPKGFLEGNVFDENGVAKVYTGFGDGYEIRIDTTGAQVTAGTSYGNMLKEGLRPELNEVVKWGFLNEEGELVIPYLYDYISGGFDRGYTTVVADGVYGLLKNPILCSDWAAEELKAAEAAGYVTESCEFYKTDSITRRQFAELSVNYLEKALGQELVPAIQGTFTDTEEETVLKAYAAGIVQGRGNGVFDPEGLLTRQELAAMLYRAMTGAGVEFTDTDLDLGAYTDGTQVDGWAQEAMSALVAGGVLQGTGGNSLSPRDNCTVEQAILLIYRAA